MNVSLEVIELMEEKRKLEKERDESLDNFWYFIVGPFTIGIGGIVMMFKVSWWVYKLLWLLSPIIAVLAPLYFHLSYKYWVKELKKVEKKLALLKKQEKELTLLEKEKFKEESGKGEKKGD